MKDNKPPLFLREFFVRAVISNKSLIVTGCSDNDWTECHALDALSPITLIRKGGVGGGIRLRVMSILTCNSAKVKALGELGPCWSVA